MWTRCPFCHERILTAAYPEHERTHTRRRADGQMDEHITLPPEQRATVDLTGVPRIYYHPKCGAMTGMPEEIIRSYLQDPFLYNGLTFCTGCHAYVPEGDLLWTETNESLAVYMERLKHEFTALNMPRGALQHSAPAKREFSGWRVLILLLILVIVVPALVVDTVIALHSMVHPTPTAPRPTLGVTPPSSPVLPPPVVLSAPPPQAHDFFPQRPRPSPGFPSPQNSRNETVAIQEAALASVPAFIRQFHPVQSRTGSLTVTSTDALRTSDAQATVTVHYEIQDSNESKPTQLGAARMLLQRTGPAWDVVAIAPLGTD